MADQPRNSATVGDMLDEEPEINLTPMIDVVFLLLIFFMMMKFKQLERKLDSEMPKDEGQISSPPEPIQQLRWRLTLSDVPAPAPGVVPINLIPNPVNEVFQIIPWNNNPADMFNRAKNGMVRGYDYIGEKVEIAPDAEVPFEYVANLLDAIHAMKREVEWQRFGPPPAAEQDDPYAEERLRITFMAADPNRGALE